MLWLVNFVRRWRRHWAVVTLIGLIVGGGAIIAGVQKWKDGIHDFVHPQPDALEVADQQTKQQVSRDFITLAWRRLYRSQQFLARIQRGAPDEDIESGWKALLESVEEMSSKSMVYALTFGELYSDERRANFENVILSGFANMTQDVVKMRYRMRSKQLTGTQLQCEVSDLQRSFSDFNIPLYQFASCFDRRHQTDNGCLGGGISPGDEPKKRDPVCGTPNAN